VRERADPPNQKQRLIFTLLTAKAPVQGQGPGWAPVPETTGTIHGAGERDHRPTRTFARTRRLKVLAAGWRPPH